MLKEEELVESYNKSIEKWTQTISKQKYRDAKLILTKEIEVCRNIILFNQNSSEYLKNISLLYGITFRGLEELTDIAEIIAKYEWYKNTESVERVWLLLQNCKERFESSFEVITISLNVKNTIFSFLEVIEEDYLTLFGPGIYVSPEVVIKKSVCSICKSDFRTCPHLPNHIYKGRICRCEPTEIEPGNCIVILPRPKDPRCRIWPWKYKNGGIDDVPIIFSFKIDDFLD